MRRQLVTLGTLALLALAGCATTTGSSSSASGWVTSDEAILRNPSLPPNMYPAQDYGRVQYFRPGISPGTPLRVRPD